MYPLYLAGPVTGLRAYTDPISNAVANSAVNPFHVRRELGLGRLDPKYLNVLLHETTHHSTFNTPVGYVLGALMAAHTADPVGIITDQENVEGPARIMILAEAMSVYFTPMLEGLALFAEFDALAGGSPVASTVSSIAFCLFCKSTARARAAAGDTIGPYDVLRLYLSEQRTKADAVQRKLALLALPLSGEDGYLIGYLWVKALWRVLIGRCRKLMDTDLFMGFLIDYFFGDFRLAALMFRSEEVFKKNMSLESDIDEIEYYIFVERLNNLVENVGDLVDQYERHATRLSPRHLSTGRDRTARPPYQNYSEDIALKIEMGLAYAAIRSMHVMWPRFAAGRYILRLLVAPAEVEIDEAGMFRATCAGCNGPIEGPALDVARPLSKQAVTGAGSVEALVLPRTLRVVIGIFLGHELVATVDAASGQINDAEAATACDRLSSYLALEAAAVQIANEVRFTPGSRAEKLYSYTRTRSKSKAYEYFSKLALGTDIGMPPDESLLRELNVGGVVELLAPYPGQAEWLTRLSLSVGGRPTTFSQAAADWGVTPDDVRQWCAAINETLKRRCGKETFVVGDSEFGFSQF